MFVVVLMVDALKFGSTKRAYVGKSRLQVSPEVDSIAEVEAPTAPRSIGVASYFEKTMSTLGKTPIPKLRELISKYNPKGDLPADITELDSHCMAAMDAIWKSAQDPMNTLGDDIVWPTFMATLDAELGKTIAVVDKAIAASVEYANTLSESKIKELIIKYDNVNAIPSIDKNKHSGKFGKGDYAVVLMDILREANDNDYQKVAAILSSHKQEKKGFGA
jgi:hypothetical protein